MSFIIIIHDVTNVTAYSRLKQDFINFFLQAILSMYLKLAFKIWCHFVSNLHMTLYPHMYQNMYGNLLPKNFSIQDWPLYKCL